MADNKKSFILYRDQRGIFNKLSDEQAGVLIKHIFAYVSDENPTADFVTELAFESIKTQLKRDLKTWESKQEQRKQAGLRSAEVRRRNSTTVNDRSFSSTVNGNGNGNVTVNETKEEHTEIGFNQFWDLYDIKLDLVPCQREWMNIDSAEYVKILAHVPKFVAATPDKKYRKKPINYLKDRTWMDEDLPITKDSTIKKPEKFIPNPIKL